MSNNALAAGVGAAAAAVSVGPLAEVFSEMGLVMAIMGALGGAMHAIMNRRRPILTWFANFFGFATSGAILAFGLGVLAPPILAWALRFEIAASDQSTGMLAAAGFLIGLMQERVVQLIRVRPDDKE